MCANRELQRRLEKGIHSTAANMSKKSYVCEKRRVYVKRDLWRRTPKETYEYEQRAAEETRTRNERYCSKHFKRDICVWKETYGRELQKKHLCANKELQERLKRGYTALQQICQKRPVYMKRDLWKRTTPDSYACKQRAAEETYIRIHSIAANMSKETCVYKKRPIKENYTGFVRMQTESCRRNLHKDTQHCSKYVKRVPCMWKDTYRTGSLCTYLLLTSLFGITIQNVWLRFSHHVLSLRSFSTFIGLFSHL